MDSICGTPDDDARSVGRNGEPKRDSLSEFMLNMSFSISLLSKSSSWTSFMTRLATMFASDCDGNWHVWFFDGWPHFLQWCARLFSSPTAILEV